MVCYFIILNIIWIKANLHGKPWNKSKILAISIVSNSLWKIKSDFFQVKCFQRICMCVCYHAMLFSKSQAHSKQIMQKKNWTNTILIHFDDDE